MARSFNEKMEKKRQKVICKLHFLQIAISVASPLRIVFAQLPTI